MKIWCLCSLVYLSCCVSAEIFSAVTELEGLLGTEAKILESMESFIKKAQERINSLKRELLNHKIEHSLAMENVEETLTNPISAYLLIKRVAVDLKIIEQKMFFDELTKDALFQLEEIQNTMPYATSEDLTGGVTALLRLQDTYNLNTSSLASGNINGIQSLGRLTAKDCYNIGVYAFTKEDFYHTILWMKEAIVLLNGRLYNAEGVKRWEALEFLAFSYYKEGNIKEALRATEELLKVYPNHKGALINRDHYIGILKNITPNYLTHNYNSLTESDLYGMTCRNDISPSPSVTFKLGCRYVSYQNPFLRLAPIKEDMAYSNPNITLFKNALTEEEIKLIIDLSKKRLMRAGFENSTTGESEFHDHVRLSKYAWLAQSDGEWVKKIFKRVEDMTSLTTETAESMQVVNYGIGGHYKVHEDFATVKSSKITSFGTGNRIATILFYLSDVPQGGATVFPNLHLHIQPEKGTALFWWNLFPDGQGDPLTRHAACPVLVGSKWVATIWLHEGGQEFRRPCELFPNTPAVLFQ